MKPHHFFKGLSWLILLNILIKPVWIFAIDRQVQNIVGFKTYGTYFAVLNLSIIFSFIADAGLTNMMNRQISIEGKTSAIHFKALLLIKLGLLLLYGCIVFLVGWITGLSHWMIVWQVIIIQALTSLFLFCRNIITANQLFTTDAWLSVIDKLLMIVLCGAYIYLPFTFGTINLTRFLNSQILCTAIAVCVAGSILFQKKLLIAGSGKSMDKTVLAAVIPFSLILLLMSAHSRLDGFLLERLHANGPHEAGVYASAYRLLDAGNMIGYLAASFLVPFIARNLENHLLLQKTVLLLRHALLTGGLVAVAFVLVFGNQVEQQLYHTASAYNVWVLQLGIAVLPAYYLVHVYGSLLTAMGQFKAFIRILFFCVLINGTINLIFIPVYGARACCVAALISQYSCGILVYISGSGKNKIKLGIKAFVWYLIVATSVMLLFFWTKQLIIR